MNDDIKKYMAVIEAATEKPASQAPKQGATLNESAQAVASKEPESETEITSVEALLDEARSKGFDVLEENEIRAIQTGETSVVVWENGSITRGDVPLDKMKRMTLSEAATHLGL